MLPQLRRAAERRLRRPPGAARSATAPTRCRPARCPTSAPCSLVVRDRTDEMRREFAEARLRLQRRPRAAQPAGRDLERDRGPAGRRQGRPGGARPLPRPPRRGRRADEPPDPVAAHPGPGRVAGRGERPRWSTSRSRSATPSRPSSAPAARRAARRGRARSGRQGRPDAAAPGDDRPAHQRLQAHATARHRYRSRPPRRRGRDRDDRSDRHRQRESPRRRSSASSSASTAAPRPASSEGFGLGLSIARRMVDVMGGEIGATLGRGRGQHLLGPPAAPPSRAPTPVA